MTDTKCPDCGSTGTPTGGTILGAPVYACDAQPRGHVWYSAHATIGRLAAALVTQGQADARRHALYLDSFPAASTSEDWLDRIVTQGHADYCRDYGHADAGSAEFCPRCGDAREAGAPRYYCHACGELGDRPVCHAGATVAYVSVGAR